MDSLTVNETRKAYWHMKIPEFYQYTPDQLLGVAIDCEQAAQDIGPFDPAYTHYIQCALDYEKAAYFKASLVNK